MVRLLMELIRIHSRLVVITKRYQSGSCHSSLDVSLQLIYKFIPSVPSQIKLFMATEPRCFDLFFTELIISTISGPNTYEDAAAYIQLKFESLNRWKFIHLACETYEVVKEFSFHFTKFLFWPCLSSFQVSNFKQIWMLENLDSKDHKKEILHTPFNLEAIWSIFSHTYCAVIWLSQTIFQLVFYLLERLIIKYSN